MSQAITQNLPLSLPVAHPLSVSVYTKLQIYEKCGVECNNFPETFHLKDMCNMYSTLSIEKTKSKSTMSDLLINKTSSLPTTLFWKISS